MLPRLRWNISHRQRHHIPCMRNSAFQKKSGCKAPQSNAPSAVVIIHHAVDFVSCRHTQSLPQWQTTKTYSRLPRRLRGMKCRDRSLRNNEMRASSARRAAGAIALRSGSPQCCERCGILQTNATRWPLLSVKPQIDSFSRLCASCGWESAKIG